MTQTPDPKRIIAHGPTIHAIKRAKYEAKQQRRLQQTATSSCVLSPTFLQQETTNTWFCGREESAVYVTLEDVRAIRQLRLDVGKQCRDEIKSPVVAVQRGDCRDSHNMDQSSSEKEAFAKTQSEMSRLGKIAAWIAPFFGLKETPNARTLPCAGSKNEQSNDDRLFIAEGTEAVRLLIQKCVENTHDASINAPSEKTNATDNYVQEEHRSAPPVRVVSILCKPATFFEQPVCLVDELVKKNYLCPTSLECNNRSVSHCPFKIIVGTEETLSEIVGFPLARGALACGIVPRFHYPLRWLKSLLSRGELTPKSGLDTNIPKPSQDNKTIATQAATKTVSTRILAIDAISNSSNMGSIVRTAAAFGVDAILVSDDSCDAWYRQAVRVSMGHVITVPTIRVEDLRKEIMTWDGLGMVVEDVGKCCDGGLPRVLKWLRKEMRLQCFAAVVDTDDDGDGASSLPPLVSLESMTYESSEDDSSSSWVCVLGNEGHGIRDAVVREVDYRIRIGMASGVDSLSLPIAAGILIHGLSLSNKVK